MHLCHIKIKNMKKIIVLISLIMFIQSCVITTYRHCPTNDKDYFRKMEGIKKQHYKFNQPD